MKLRSVLLVVVGAAVVWREHRRALRPRRERTLPHTARNLTIAGLAAAAVHLAERPVVMPLARLVERRRWGLVQTMRRPAWLRDAVAIMLLDYTLYLWHILSHRVPVLWRLHLVHHVDRDLDATTGLRFHFAEIASSVPWRAAQVLAIGASPRALTSWQTLTLSSVLFHHSNMRLPLNLERQLCRVLVTPRMHGIHHSAVRAESDANYSSGLSVWDRLHGTIRLNVPQASIEIGVPAYRDHKDLTLVAALALPVTHARETWQGKDGVAPEPYRTNAPRRRLLP